MWRRICLLLIVVLSLSVKGAHAVELPASADSSRFEKRFAKPLPGGEDAVIRPPQDDNITPDIPVAKEGFILEGVRLSGVSAFPEHIFDGLISEYVSHSVDLGVLNHLAARITAYYRDQGYFLSKAIIPEQDIENGIVEIRVIEGYVSNVLIDDPQGLLVSDYWGITADTIAKIKALKPLYGPALERYILLLNEGAGVYVQSIMTAPSHPEEPGAVDITLRIERQAPDYILGYNNHGSRYIGPHQAEASFSVGHVLTSYDSLVFQVVSSLPLREMQFGSVAYSTAVNAEGLSFNTSLSYASSEPGATLEPLDVQSNTVSWEGGLSYPLIRSRRANLYISGGFKLHNSSTQFLDQELIDDKTRAAVLGLSADTQDSDGSVNSLSLTFSKGLDIFGATKTGSSLLSRQEGHSDFLKVEATASRLQSLSSAFDLYTNVRGQYAPHALLSSEEFGYGGDDMGRAYDPSEITGDKGVSTSFELRYRDLPPLQNTLFFTPFSFYDIGKVWNFDSGEKPLSAASAGIGCYVQTPGGISGNITLAFPLTKDVSTPIMNGPDGPRILLEIRSSF